MWEGAACICIDEGKLLMVLQGKPEEEKCWSVPAGGMEARETIEECCIREVWEETGYRVKIQEKLHKKEGISFGIQFKVQYFFAEVEGGFPVIQDPDGLIYDIKWVSLEELDQIALSFPEDRDFSLIFFLKGRNFYRVIQNRSFTEGDVNGMEVELAYTKDLNRLSTWCEVVPEFQKNLTQYMDREDTAILKMENDNQLVGVALLKVMETEKSGTIWLHLNEEGKQHQHTIMQKSLEWLRKKGAKEYHLV